jgi:hypothetical protein
MHVADATTEEGQPVVTVREKEELGKTSEIPQQKEKKSIQKKWLKIFSQEAEQR